MKINARNFGIAGGITIGLLYAAIAIALKLYTAQSLKIVGTTLMMPKLTLLKQFIIITPYSIVVGTAILSIVAFLIFWFIATIYNLLPK